ncbi:CDP-alcohol phosphatidyltransferase family protein [Thermosipho melanesiensis]|uniref:CDP-alcohol phosphatidyltransferase family protein n=1 Tax=Thermosipho melanesiensis TaxID=46541 RepID=UPI0002EDFCCA|nr:CDP-alcohol phosphatidyltransferase family protein [Thermosipho melanesiensis]
MGIKEIMKYFDSPAAPICYIFVDRIAAFFVWINVNFFKIHPNFISIFSGIFSFYAVYYFYLGRFFWGAFFYLLAFLFDAIDGPSARALNKTSQLGIILEIWIDSLRLVGSTFAMGWYLYNSTHNVKYVFLIIVWMISFASGLWLYPKTKETFKEFIGKVKREKYIISPVPTWMDYEMFAFFFMPLFSAINIGFIVLVVGYFISSLGMSLNLLWGGRK